MIIITGVIFMGMIALGVFIFFAAMRQPVTDATHGVVELKGERFEVELARTLAEQGSGLSGRASLSQNEGMLFLFPTNQTRHFWMKGMLISIDIIWIKDEKVVGIERNIPVPPNELAAMRPYASPVPLDTVLEVVGGTSDRLGIVVGDSVGITLKK